MALKPVIETLDDVPEALREYYTETDNGFVLDFGDDDLGAHPATRSLKSALDKEKADRRKARDEAKRLAEEMEKFKDIDPERAKEALDKLQELEDADALKAGDIDKIVEQKTGRMRSDFESKLDAKDKALQDVAAERDALKGQLSEVMIFTAVKDAALKNGARETALDDIVNRAKPVFRLDDEGQVVAIKPGTDETLYGKNGEPMSIDEWVADLPKNADHLFKPNSGGGATGSDQQQGRGGVKVVSRENAGNYINEIASGEVVIGD